MGNQIDALQLKNAFLAGANNLNAKKEWINELNVFPVPDGDTGTNMTMTIMSAAREVAAIDAPTLENVAKAMASGSLRGARGNSGVILSQLIRGFTKEIREHADEAGIDNLIMARAFSRAVETAYKAVMKPKEGTILTVARGGATKACELVEENPDIEIGDLLSQTIRYMDEVLNQTPEMLPVLKEAGVVDSGGQGLVQILKGCLNGFLGIEEEEEEKEEVRKFNYRVEYILNCAKHISKEERLKFVGFLESIGADVAAERCDQGLKVYLNTDDPGAALTKATEYGTMSRIHVINNIDRPVYPLHLFDEKELEEALKEKKKGTLEPVYFTTGLCRDKNDIGNTYVEIDLTNQHMWFYKNGSLIVDTPVVTGNPQKNNETPSGGVWSLKGKYRNATLKGEGYATPVDYWLPFNGGVGIHDLQKRYYFGGSVYNGAGSHGCINTPLAAVKLIYNGIGDGTPVVVYKDDSQEAVSQNTGMQDIRTITSYIEAQYGTVSDDAESEGGTSRSTQSAEVQR